MAKTTGKSKLATSGEELGEQVLQSVREMKAGLRGRVHTPEVLGVTEARLRSGLSQAWIRPNGPVDPAQGCGRQADALGSRGDPNRTRPEGSQE